MVFECGCTINERCFEAVFRGESRFIYYEILLKAVVNVIVFCKRANLRADMSDMRSAAVLGSGVGFGFLYTR